MRDEDSAIILIILQLFAPYVQLFAPYVLTLRLCVKSSSRKGAKTGRKAQRKTGSELGDAL
jgi:hypothetical protein